MAMRIGLMGTFGYGNLGDAAIQDAMIQSIYKRFPDAEIFGFSINPEDTEARHHIRSFPITRMSWNQKISDRNLYGKFMHFLQSKDGPVYRSLERWAARIPIEWGLIADANKHLKALDILIISGGGQLDDLWAGGGPWSHPYTLLKYGLLARLNHVRYVFASVGAGPINAGLSKGFIRLALNLADFCSFRDRESQALAQSIGYGKKSAIFPDLAYSLAEPSPVNKTAGQNTRAVVGLGVVGYFRPECWPIVDQAVYAVYLNKMTEFCISVVQKGYALLFLPGEITYDQYAFDDLKERLNEKGITADRGDILDCPIHTVPELLSAIQMTDVVVASRFHGVLLSQLLEKPVLAISYHQKTDSLMEDNGQNNFLLPIDTFDVPTLLRRFAQLEPNGQEIARCLQEKNRLKRSLLEQQYEQIFSQPVSRPAGKNERIGR